MKNMDLKASNVLLQYKSILENDTFLETDIIGFLILIREYIDKGKYNQIYDMCDFIAHRFRDSGIIVDNLNNAIKNNYSTTRDNKVVDVHGFEISKITKKWIELCSDLNINIDKRIATNIMICYCSLLQFSEYALEDGKKGMVQLLEGIDNSLDVCIKENRSDAPLICFMKIPKCNFVHETYYGFIYEVLHLKRNNGALVFANGNGEDFVIF